MSKKMWNAESMERRELQNRTQSREKVIERRKKKWKVNEQNRKKVRRRRKRRHLRNRDQRDTSRFKCRTFIQTSRQRHSSNFPNLNRICLLVQKLESIVENELRSLSVTSADGELHKRCFEKLYQLTFNAVKVSRTACHVIILVLPFETLLIFFCRGWRLQWDWDRRCDKWRARMRRWWSCSNAQNSQNN